MNQLEFAFEPSGWELALNGLRRGSSFSASRFLTLLEDLTEEEVESAFSDLDEKEIELNIADLPKWESAGETAVRLRMEKQLVDTKELPGGLPEGDALRIFLEEIASIPACGDAELLAEKYLAGDDNAARLLNNVLLGRAIEAAYALAGQGVLLVDLIQEGSLGLWQAILNYQGGDIYDHCDRAVRRTLAKTLVLQARENGVGHKMRKAMEDYQTADKRLLTQLGRNPTMEEVAQALNMTMDEASAVEEMLESARMLHRAEAATQPKQEEQEDDQAVEDTAYFHMRQRIEELLDTLDKRDAMLLSMRFGLDGGLPMSPEETGRKLGLTPKEVIEKEAAALTRLRQQG